MLTRCHMAYDSLTFEADMNLLKTYLGPDTNEDILGQLRELARQVRAMQGLIAGMAGDRQDATAPAARSPLGKAVSENRVVLLRKALLGPNGGQAVLYNKTLAATLLSKELISKSEHKIWKLSNLLPERINMREARQAPVMLSRP